MAEYIPSTRGWVAEQVELYEGSGGTDGLTLRDTGLPVVIVTNTGHKTGAIRKTPLMRVVDGNSYILVASQGGAPKHSRADGAGWKLHSGDESPNRNRGQDIYPRRIDRRYFRWAVDLYGRNG